MNTFLYALLSWPPWKYIAAIPAFEASGSADFRRQNMFSRISYPPEPSSMYTPRILQSPSFARHSEKKFLRMTLPLSLGFLPV